MAVEEGLIGRLNWLIYRGVPLSGSKAVEALREFDRTGDVRLIREFVEEAEQRVTLLHSRECKCEICGRKAC